MTGAGETQLVYDTTIIALCAAAAWLALGAFMPRSARKAQGAATTWGAFAFAGTLVGLVFAVVELFMLAAVVGTSSPPLPALIGILAALAIPLWILLAIRTRNAFDLPGFTRRSQVNGTIFIVIVALTLEGIIFRVFRHPWVIDALLAVLSGVTYFGNREARRNRANVSTRSSRR